MRGTAIVACGAVLLLGPATGVSAQDAGQMPNRCPSSLTITRLSSPSWNGWGADAGNTRFQPADAAQLSAAPLRKSRLPWPLLYLARDALPCSEPIQAVLSLLHETRQRRVD